MNIIQYIYTQTRQVEMTDSESTAFSYEILASVPSTVSSLLHVSAAQQLSKLQDSCLYIDISLVPNYPRVSVVANVVSLDVTNAKFNNLQSSVIDRIPEKKRGGEAIPQFTTTALLQMSEPIKLLPYDDVDFEDGSDSSNFISFLRLSSRVDNLSEKSEASAPVACHQHIASVTFVDACILSAISQWLQLREILLVSQNKDICEKATVSGPVKHYFVGNNCALDVPTEDINFGAPGTSLLCCFHVASIVHDIESIFICETESVIRCTAVAAIYVVELAIANCSVCGMATDPSEASIKPSKRVVKRKFDFCFKADDFSSQLSSSELFVLEEVFDCEAIRAVQSEPSLVETGSHYLAILPPSTLEVSCFARIHTLCNMVEQCVVLKQPASAVHLAPATVVEQQYHIRNGSVLFRPVLPVLQHVAYNYVMMDRDSALRLLFLTSQTHVLYPVVSCCVRLAAWQQLEWFFGCFLRFR
jgi:hypothetical protein